MYAQSHPTLPSITAAIGNGVDKFNSSSLGNGEHHIKQEQDFEHNPSLPPIRTNPINHSNGNIDTSNHSRMSINQLCNDTVDSDYPEEMKAAAAVLENLKTTAVTTLPSIDNISPQPLEPRPHAEQPQLPSSEAGFMLSIVKKTMDVYEQATTSTSYPERSRWQRMVIGTGAAVGAAGAAVSEESMKSLKYCQEWINYATQHIDAQIIVLKEFIVNLTNPSTRTVARTSSTSTLASIKKEVVETLRKVIEVVSKYAGVCLPDQAKRSVRTFILNLPTRWASINHTEHSSSPSPMSSPQLAPANGHPLNQTTDYARRLLSLATESLDMLISVSGIFGETVGRAEAWLERLRAVGMPTSMGANSTVNLQFDNVYGSSNTSSHSSPPGSRSRRTSNSVRPNGHGVRKVSRPTPVHVEDDDSTFNGHDSDSSSESEAEPMRMEMDHAQKRALKKANAKSQSNGALNGIKKRKKGGKKENDNIMDLS